MSTLMEVVVALVWACLEIPGAQNSLFPQLFFAFNIVADIAATASLSFCPGLQEALADTSPPEVSWFKSLPADYKRKWGVYVLIFKKDGHVPHLYCGSATDSQLGVSSRWATYSRHNTKLRDNVEGLPSGVLKAFQSGFKITHKGLLVTAPIPSPAHAPMLRLLFYAMEATFSFAFWTMSTNQHLLYHSCRRFSYADLTYIGLCSHSPLHDPIQGRFDLTSEELTTLAADVKEKQRLYWRLYARAYRAASFAADPEGYREKGKLYQDQYRQKALATDPDGYRARQRKHNDTYRINSHEKSVAKQRRYTARHKANEDEMFCEICELSCSKRYEWERHLNSTNHKSRERKIELGIDLPHRCDVCRHSCAKASQLKSHCAGKRHKERVAEHEAALAASSSSST